MSHPALSLAPELVRENEAMTRMGGPGHALRALSHAIDAAKLRHPALDVRLTCDGRVGLLSDRRVWTVAASVAGRAIAYGSSTPRRLGLLAERAASDFDAWCADMARQAA